MSIDSPPVPLCPPPSGSSAYSPPDAFKISIPIRNNYMYARVRKALPELYAFTVCVWLRSRSGGTGQGTPFSHSVPGQANEIVLLEAGHDPMELLINDKVSGGGQSWTDGRQGSPFQKHHPVLGPTYAGPFHSPAHMPSQAGVWKHSDKPDLGLAEEGLVSTRGWKCGTPFTGEAREAHRNFVTSPRTYLWRGASQNPLKSS